MGYPRDAGLNNWPVSKTIIKLSFPAYRSQPGGPTKGSASGFVTVLDDAAQVSVSSSLLLRATMNQNPPLIKHLKRSHDL